MAGTGAVEQRAEGQQPSGPMAVAGPVDEATGGMLIPFADEGNPIMAQVSPYTGHSPTPAPVM